MNRALWIVVAFNKVSKRVCCYFCSSFGTASYLYVSEKICRSERALLPAHLDAIRLSMLPMAIGLNSPSIFMWAISFPPKKKGLRGSGILPSQKRFISLVSDFRKLSPALPFDLLTRSLKNLSNNFCQDLLLIRSERTLLLCIGRNRLRKNYPNILDFELQIWLAEGA